PVLIWICAKLCLRVSSQSVKNFGPSKSTIDFTTEKGLHSVKPTISKWPILSYRKSDVKVSRLRIGHTRYTHRGNYDNGPKVSIFSLPKNEELKKNG
ncbi:unnamed protein product, partial [Larinioides sclopetarius]